MQTLNKIAFDILTEITPLVSDDQRFTLEKVKHDIAVERATFIRNEANKLREVRFLRQDLGCVPLEKVDIAECCDFEIGCKVLRTADVIPRPIQAHNQTFTIVGPIDKHKKRYEYISYDEAIYSGHGQYNKHLIFAYRRNDRIYLKSNSPNLMMLKYISIQDIFEDPTEAARFVDCDDVPCYTDDSLYPVDATMGGYIAKSLIERYKRNLNNATVDNQNDARSKKTDMV